ncbi:uncharacterized protein LOC103941171 isoform X3 [Pyrus x bretschneideri]|uniref:uncharacterized protein LOC103941171 isoform X3 n=1 Tax=Pyrus x bretschneideri TaxID=225117 RepID=UPI00202FED62|nr:uncharacterized protein LOC103941171 isoform X3 [Pyrus x bretschneideri]
MLENPPSAAAAAADPGAVVKRYAPPNQRNRPLNRRKSAGWAAAMRCFNDPSVDLPERPVMYTGSSSAWGPFLLPHQLMASTVGAGSPGSPMDFLSELFRSKNISGAGFET